MNSDNHAYDIAIIGGGVSGSALLYVLAKYTNTERIALIEKYSDLGSVNSNPKNNSQTLHVGDIETNYNLEKVKQVYPASMMVKKYTDSLPAEERSSIIKSVQKMVLGIGHEEVKELEKRYEEIKEVFPVLEKISGAQIAHVEPEIMRGRSNEEPVLALYNPEGYSVNFSLLAKSLARKALESKPHARTLLNHAVEKITRENGMYSIHTSEGIITAPIVIVDADAYSLYFAKTLGYGKEFSLIPVAGSFYFTPEKLKGKVYRVQEKRMPFAAVHGDPDLTRQNATRWGPTARFYPVLEARNVGTMKDFFKASGLNRLKTWVSFFVILLDPLRFWYLIKNLFYDLPFIGKYFFLPQIKKIIPTLSAKDIQQAKMYGGMRLQRVDTNKRELLLGEGKIVGEKIIFNMSPSPGASVCLYNAMRDADEIINFSDKFIFDKEKMLQDLCVTHEPLIDLDVSLPDSYAS